MYTDYDGYFRRYGIVFVLLLNAFKLKIVRQSLAHLISKHGVRELIPSVEETAFPVCDRSGNDAATQS